MISKRDKIRVKNGNVNAPINDVILVKMLECKDDFSSVEASAVFREAALLLEVVEELAARLVVHDEVKLCF